MNTIHLFAANGEQYCKNLCGKCSLLDDESSFSIVIFVTQLHLIHRATNITIYKSL